MGEKHPERRIKIIEDLIKMMLFDWNTLSRQQIKNRVEDIKQQAEMQCS